MGNVFWLSFFLFFEGILFLLSEGGLEVFVVSKVVSDNFVFFCECDGVVVNIYVVIEVGCVFWE